ncbi:MAG TPA: hypothetical protein VMT12_07215 [Syntrophales bacterium]|nr:hypothetical protein [Syntrophales bacterium]
MRNNWHLIETYRTTLKPEIYFLCARMDENAITVIEETVEEYTLQEDRDRYGVIFVYSPSGSPNAGVLSLTTSVEETPHLFQTKLIEYLEKKLEDH